MDNIQTSSLSPSADVQVMAVLSHSPFASLWKHRSIASIGVPEDI